VTRSTRSQRTRLVWPLARVPAAQNASGADAVVRCDLPDREDGPQAAVAPEPARTPTFDDLGLETATVGHSSRSSG